MDFLDLITIIGSIASWGMLPSPKAWQARENAAEFSSRHSGGGEVRVVHQNHEDEKNTSEFFEVNTEAPRSVINWYF